MFVLLTGNFKLILMFSVIATLIGLSYFGRRDLGHEK